MSLFSNRLIGRIVVETKGNFIHIDGVNVKELQHTLAHQFHTSKLENIVKRVNWGEIKFQQFYAVEMLFMLQEIMNNKRYRRYFNYRMVEQMLTLLREETWVKKTTQPQKSILDYSQLSQFKLTPLPHQSDYFRQYDDIVPRYNLNGYLLSAPAGTGKTFTNLALSAMLNADVVIIVAPNNSLDTVWRKSIKELIATHPDAWVSRDEKPLSTNYKYYVFHYEALNKAVELANMLKVKKPVVILDESHNFNETSAARTNLFVDLCHTLPNASVLWQSGTPIKAIGNEAIPLLKTIDPLFTNGAENDFRLVFGKNSTTAIQILAHRLGVVSFKVEKSTVVDIKPEVQPVKIKLPHGEQYTLDVIRREMTAFIKDRTQYYKASKPALDQVYLDIVEHFAKGLKDQKDKEALQLYRSRVATIARGYDPVAHKEIARWVNQYESKVIEPTLNPTKRKEFRNVKSVYKYVALKIQGECLGRILGRKRIQCNTDLVVHTDFETLVDGAEKKTLVFTSFVEVVKQCEEQLKRLGYKTVSVHGETNKDLNKHIKQFDTDPDTNPLIATFDSLSTAVPLIMANNIIMMNSPFRHYEFDQAVSRCARLGQDQPVRVWMVQLDTGEIPNISTRAADIMDWSMKQVAHIMGTEPVLTPDDTETVGSVATECMYIESEHFTASASLSW